MHVAASGTLTLEGLTLQGGSLVGPADHAAGGGLFNRGTLALIASRLTSNSVHSGPGGGIWNAGLLTLTTTVLADNTASGGGGI